MKKRSANKEVVDAQLSKYERMVKNTINDLPDLPTPADNR